MSKVIASAIERFRRDRIFAEAAVAYRAAPPDDDLALWDGTLLDGLPDEPEE